MTNTETVTEPAATPPKPTSSQTCLASLDDEIAHLQRIRDFVERYADRIDGVHCGAYKYGVAFYLWEWKQGMERDPRKIAQRWPGWVWRRKANSSKCGTCDWVAELNGIKLTIDEAEKMKWVPDIDSPVEEETKSVEIPADKVIEPEEMA